MFGGQRVVKEYVPPPCLCVTVSNTSFNKNSPKAVSDMRVLVKIRSTCGRGSVVITSCGGTGLLAQPQHHQNFSNSICLSRILVEALHSCQIKSH